MPSWTTAQSAGSRGGKAQPTWLKVPGTSTQGRQKLEIWGKRWPLGEKQDLNSEYKLPESAADGGNTEPQGRLQGPEGRAGRGQREVCSWKTGHQKYPQPWGPERLSAESWTLRAWCPRATAALLQWGDVSRNKDQTPGWSPSYKGVGRPLRGQAENSHCGKPWTQNRNNAREARWAVSVQKS